MKPLPSIAVIVLTACTAIFAVNVGETAPAFSLATSSGSTFSVAQQKGKVVVLFFLGCT